MKLFGGLIGLIVMSVIWWQRREGMRNRLAEFDNGTRCIACHSTNMAIAEGKARCGNCMHVSDLSALRAAAVSESDIADLTKPK
jgi:hypothetical protein